VTWRQIQRELTAELAAAGIEPAAREARALLASVLAVSEVRIHREPETGLTDEHVTRLRALGRRRAGREPLAWLTGQVGFCGLDFAIRPGVLVPRPDSEVLVETAWQRARTLHRPDGQPLRLLDACCGSGCIGISLAVLLRQAGRLVRLELTDLDETALACARQNLRQHRLPEAGLLQADLIPAGAVEPYDLIVANPPYIPSGQIDSLLPEVSRFEPRLALDGGPDGLGLCRRLIAAGAQHLSADGWLYLEHGFDQGDRIGAALLAEGFAQIEQVRDYAGHLRVCGGCPGRTPAARVPDATDR
jgi:release factor glutamine methyltransferase